MIFKIYNSDFGFVLDGVTYDFEHVMELQVEDPEMTKLTRGANAKNKVGLVYREGTKDPKKVTVTIVGMDKDLKAALDNAYENKKRVDVYAVDRETGSRKTYNNAVLCQQPQQLQISENVESMHVALAFESFDAKEEHKA